MIISYMFVDINQYSKHTICSPESFREVTLSLVHSVDGLKWWCCRAIDLRPPNHGVNHLRVSDTIGCCNFLEDNGAPCPDLSHWGGSWCRWILWRLGETNRFPCLISVLCPCQSCDLLSCGHQLGSPRCWIWGVQIPEFSVVWKFLQHRQSCSCCRSYGKQ